MRAVLAWLGVIVVGTGLLRLPAASTGEALTMIDALFTSTSALCVTGLSTVTVGERLSPFGQVVLLSLIQLGGLGITTLSTFMLVAAGRATLSHQLAAKDTLAAVRMNPMRLIWLVIAVTVTAEVAGTVALKSFLGAGTGWWVAAFHSVSAFCNAGFSLFPDSMVAHRGTAPVNVTLSSLIIAGGLGFIAIHQIGSWLWRVVRRNRQRMFLHARTTILMSLALWVLGMLLFGVLEWDGAMADLPVRERLWSAWFQSVTTRTAGFNTLEFSRLREPTLFFTMFLMLVGGAPGGCAGGIKVTTFAVLLAAVRARLSGTQQMAMLRRKLPPEIVERSFLLVALSVFFLTIVVSGLLLTEEMRPVSDVRSDRYLLLAFEAVSAFGTVGLSAGITADLSTGGKLLIIVCMFIGRLGPLGVALAVLRPKRPPPFEYPVEELAIG